MSWTVPASRQPWLASGLFLSRQPEQETPRAEGPGILWKLTAHGLLTEWFVDHEAQGWPLLPTPHTQRRCLLCSSDWLRLCGFLGVLTFPTSSAQ